MKNSNIQFDPFKKCIEDFLYTFVILKDCRNHFWMIISKSSCAYFFISIFPRQSPFTRTGKWHISGTSRPILMFLESISYCFGLLNRFTRCLNLLDQDQVIWSRAYVYVAYQKDVLLPFRGWVYRACDLSVKQET